MCIFAYSYTEFVGVFMVLWTVEDAGPYKKVCTKLGSKPHRLYRPHLIALTIPFQVL